MNAPCRSRKRCRGGLSGPLRHPCPAWLYFLSPENVHVSAGTDKV
jgi:hypothetical protein